MNFYEFAKHLDYGYHTVKGWESMSKWGWQPGHNARLSLAKAARNILWKPDQCTGFCEFNKQGYKVTRKNRIRLVS